MIFTEGRFFEPVLDLLDEMATFNAVAIEAPGGSGYGVDVGFALDLLGGFRVSASAGPGLVYSGDVGVADDLAPLIRPGDVLLSEVSFGAGPVDPAAQHLDGPAVGRVAAISEAGRVLLTHLQMGHDRAATIASVRREYDGPVELVEPGYRTTI